MKITVIGVGYVGLVSAVGFAEMGNKVICLSRNARKIQLLNRGIPTIYEPGLQSALRLCLNRGLISFTNDKPQAIRASKIIFIAVGTPAKKDGSADISAVLSVAKDIGQHMNAAKIVVTKSTVPVGTSAVVKATIKKSLSRKRFKFEVASNPEFLREGSALKHFREPDRVVVGVENIKTSSVLARLYRPIIRRDRPLVVTNVRSAELIKYAANAFLVMKISFINEIANYCDAVGADVTEIARGIGLDPRIGRHFLRAGVGYGGSCLPKDVSSLIASGRKVGQRFQILQAVQRVNAEQRRVIIRKLRNFVPKLKGKIIAIWGLSFKPNTDDVRGAPAIAIIRDLFRAGAHVRAYDPVTIPEAKKVLPGSNRIYFSSNKYDALKKAEALLIVTEWQEFRRADFRWLRKLMRSRNIIDGRNMYDPRMVRRWGFKYVGVGRP